MEKLKPLFENAGFTNVNISIVIKQMRCPSVEKFVAGGMMATPFFQEIQDMPRARRNGMFQEICRLNRDYIDDNGLAAPAESDMVHAVK